MDLTITAKIKIEPSTEQIQLLRETMAAYRSGCNFVSGVIFSTGALSLVPVHNETYRPLREQFALRSQMAQSAMKTVIARYRSAKSNGHDWSLVKFKKPEYDLVWNRDYSLYAGRFSVNTLAGRIKVPIETKGMSQYFDGTWSFGTAKLVNKHGKFFLHIPMTKAFPDVKDDRLSQVVGIDFGMNFLATVYDSDGKTTFYSGRHVKDRRAHYQRVRKSLQRIKTPSSRRRLKSLGSRETRWMTDVNHQLSKALVSEYGSDTLFVIEDLTGIRGATERVCQRSRYYSVSWAFFQLRRMLEYKAALTGSKVIAVDPRYTSQTCPKCGHREKGSRNKKLHAFTCKSCGYQSNDDRIGAMNLQRIGSQYIAEVTQSA